ncbi:MAG: hypothetical protein JEZ02_09810 [Desulfatibacillum sp.]|nr:hypothetical protein [Desulfatibacillum sp.]
MKKTNRNRGINIRKDNNLLECLFNQIAFLESSAKAFDEGELREAIRMATQVRVLMHETRNSKSLLGQLNVRHTLKYNDTSAPYRPDDLMSYTGLCAIKVSDTIASYHAPLNTRGWKPKKVTLGQWWNGFVVDDRAGTTLSRKDVVSLLANKEGGAHVDTNMSNEYKKLKTGELAKWVKVDTEGDGFMRDFHLFTMRQITYEMLVTLEQLQPYLPKAK